VSERRHERAKEDIEKWGPVASTLIYCELCEQVFTSGDIFYYHRHASESELARQTYETDDDTIGEEFGHYRELTASDEFPENATVGVIEPCEPVEEGGSNE
jgi:hypothetical protein